MITKRDGIMQHENEDIVLSPLLINFQSGSLRLNPTEKPIEHGDNSGCTFDKHYLGYKFAKRSLLNLIAD